MAAVALAAALSAHEFTIDGYRVAGGRGASSGGAFTVISSIGQPVAGAMNGGAYSLLGGFRSIVATVPTAVAPTLGVLLTNGVVTVFWPPTAEGWILEEARAVESAPATGSWSPVLPPYSSNATHAYISVPAPSGTAFYRLIRP
jgi:hypothetical protein